MNHFPLILCGFICLAGLLPVKAEEAWLKDPAAGIKLAAGQSKQVLVAFTGNTWARPSINLWKKVLTLPEIQQMAAAKFVLVQVDYLGDTSADETKRLDVLLAQMKVEIFPTVVLLTGEGSEFSRYTNYNDGDPEAKSKFVSWLQANMNGGKTANGGMILGLDESDVLTLLNAGSETDEIVAELQTKGYGGKKDADTLKSLRTAGAKPSLLLAIAKAPAGKPEIAKNDGGAAPRKDRGYNAMAGNDADEPAKPKVAKNNTPKNEGNPPAGGAFDGIYRTPLEAAMSHGAEQVLAGRNPNIPKAAAKGDAEAQYLYGRMLTSYEHKSKDQYANVMTMFRASANKGYAGAQVALGDLYSNLWDDFDEHPVKKNMPEALKWYRKAAAQGNRQAIWTLEHLGEK